MSGTVYGLGVGPGDPELVTLKALRLLRAAAVVAYPAPETGDSFARQIVAPHLPGGQQEIAIRMPLGDGQFPKAEIYDGAAEQILAHVAVGRDVAVLCEGDPFFYGSFVYLYERLAGRCAVQVVPGVTSLVACAGVAGRPLARRNETLTVVPAPLADDALRMQFAGAEAMAIIKVGRHLSRIRRLLTACARLDGACLVERATLATQRIAPLRDLRDDAAPYFSMVLVPSREAVR
jgi:precorrin-2/cobalt-factor-2 C20-methyltransferase